MSDAEIGIESSKPVTRMVDIPELFIINFLSTFIYSVENYS
jgi:hypothetical protein